MIFIIISFNLLKKIDSNKIDKNNKLEKYMINNTELIELDRIYNEIIENNITIKCKIIDNIEKLERTIIDNNKYIIRLTMPQPSTEQKDIIEKIEKNNLIIDSVAGSGKTTTNLFIAKKYNNKKILLLTYNKKLRLETNLKKEIYNINNLEVHTYHSFCVKYYDRVCFRDDVLLQIVRTNKKPIKNFSYNIIILDEAQDINPVYYGLVCKIFKDNKHLGEVIDFNDNLEPIYANNVRLCVLGDKNQSIYDFNNADNRFMIYGDKIFNFNNDSWERLNLSTSFRVTKPISLFVNKCLLGDNRIKSEKEGRPVRYIICDTFRYGSGRPYKEFRYYMDKGYSHDDIFILAPSVKSQKSPIRILANRISQKGIPIYVPNSDEEKLDEDILKNKLVFSTFHQVKGLERKVVIIFNFDYTYFKFFKQHVDPYICPNEIYVACTRALECLSVIHHYQNDYLPFVKRREIYNYCYFEEDERISIQNNNKIKNIKTPVTDLIKHMPVNILTDCLKYIDINIIQNKQNKINIPIKTQQGDLYENVSDITGIAIPAYLELKKTGNMTIYTKEIFNKKETSEYLFSDEETIEQHEIKYEDINIKNILISHLLYISAKWLAYTSGYIYKLNQIKDYNWITENNLEMCYNRLDKLISNKAIYEKKIEIENKKELYNRQLCGYIDCIDEKTVWEFKCVEKIEQDHIIQLAVYMYLVENTKNSYVDNKLKYIKNKLSILNINLEQIEEITDEYKDKIYFDIEKIKYKDLDDIIELIYNFNNEKKIETIYYTENGIEYKYKLMNILDNEIIEISSNMSKLKLLIENLIRNKYFNKTKKTDEEFINDINKIRNSLK